MKKYFISLFLCISIFSNANVKLPLLFNDGMVLQREQKIPVWGWADANEKIEIRFNKQIINTKADKNGKWMINLKAEKAGGPFEFLVKGKNTIALKNVLVGEVWICSGQSNMEFTVGQAMNFTQEIKDADFPMIRQFLVEKDMALTPKQTLKSGQWNECNKNTVGSFTAVGYFFAKKLFTELKVPIGIINTSWGGTCVETWTSREAFESSKEFKEMISKVPNIEIDSLLITQKKQLIDKIEQIQGSKIATDVTSFKNLTFNDVNWPVMNVPGLWENQQLQDLNGVVWFRKSFEISKENAGKAVTLELSKIDDQDVTYVNGVEIGTTNNYNQSRVYNIPAGVLKEGANIISVKVTDYSGGGGIWGDASNLKLTVEKTVIPLAGHWKFNVVDIKSELSPNSYPSLLFNAMVNPLIPYGIKGVLWYQGEANASRAEQYKKAFPLMINDWRQKWHQADFPFYFVQLSSFDEFGGNSNKGSMWAELREAQQYTLETVCNTGMCVTTDIGDAKDIHPTNKQDVGSRLAAIALNKNYNQKVIYSGPKYESIEIKDNKIILTFSSVGSGLMTPDKYGYLKGFEIAGKDKIFHYAKAYIDDNKVIVFNDEVQDPIAIHYGWADDASDCNLYNNEKFPAIPFRTDDWDMTTAGVKYYAQ
ncbi:sialate O-acetylesterase [Flavobacterium piscis]|uniref:Sialate O-acetylesterase n=1 Tax=Flavobacterium piscis TaxID=1114874 RepID=A0ABU1Y854_9FLAO|nr:sialate O-acetylesterase [Flavobacterium piscis]MDR7210273.1 sialate O-acetylesterase [Flavobacterium piscis]